MSIERATLKFPNDKAGRKALSEKIVSFKANGWREIGRLTDGDTSIGQNKRGMSFFRKPESPDQQIIVHLERNMGIIDL